MDKARENPQVGGMSDALKTLLTPFAQGLLAAPQAGIFLRAEAGPGPDWLPRLRCEQSFKPAHDLLQEAGYRVEPEITGEDFDLALCLLTKHKAENLANLGRAWAMLRPGGTLVCAGGKDVGAGSIERALKAEIGAVASLSKSHCRVFWAERNAVSLAHWAGSGRLQVAPQTGCWSRPGLYNWNKVDVGSALLAAHLPDDLSGRVADLGAGWGYLSLKLLEQAAAITTLDLFEAEWHALEAAKANLKTAAKLAFHWHDVTSGLPRAAYDFVVMNPPFHLDKATDIDIGRAFITSAAQGLVPKGRLLMVANRQLPYEDIIAKTFRRSTTIVESGGFKVILAERPLPPARQR